MTLMQKKEIVNQITTLLYKLIEVDNNQSPSVETGRADKPLEMLTIKECTQLVDGLSEHTVRQLVAQDKVAAIRTGAGRNGKILISKISLLRYLGGA